MVYLDPPYFGSAKIHGAAVHDTEEEYWEWVRQLSMRCYVVCTAYRHPDDFMVEYSFGNTVNPNMCHVSDCGVREVLVTYRDGLMYHRRRRDDDH